MANAFSPALYQVIYQGMYTVSRELVGMIGRVSMESTAERVGAGQSITSPVVRPIANQNITPGATSPEGADTAPDTVTLTISKQRKQSWHFTAEEYKALEAGNMVVMPVTMQRVANAFRQLTNELEKDLTDLYVSASRAYGTTGTVPFATSNDLSDLSQLRRILNDNGAPPTDRAFVMNSEVAASLLGKQGTMFRVNEAGSSGPRNDGMMDNLFGFDLGESGQFAEHTAGGTLTGVMINVGAGEPVGETTLAVDGAAAGETRNAGDFITLAGDANKYIVRTAAAASFTSLEIAQPGLREAAADNTVITGGGNYTPSLGFSRDAIHLAARFPALPPNGDLGTHMPIRDPFSGLMFELSHYPQYRQASYEVSLCWGMVVTNPAHLAILLG